MTSDNMTAQILINSNANIAYEWASNAPISKVTDMAIELTEKMFTAETNDRNPHHIKNILKAVLSAGFHELTGAKF